MAWTCRGFVRVSVAAGGGFVTRAWWLAWGLWLSTVALFGLAVAMQETIGDPAQQDSRPEKIGWSIAFVGLATVGALVASRQPRNAVGWIFGGMAVLLALTLFVGEYANYTLGSRAAGLPFGTVAGWVWVWSWYPIGALAAFVVLLFPDGRVPGRLWGRLLPGLAALAAAATMLVSLVLGPDERRRLACLA